MVARYKMRKYNKEEYREKMIQVYGEAVVRDFEKFERRKNPLFPVTYKNFKERMKRYVYRIGCIDEGVKADKSNKKISNYYANKRFARFILISIEKYYGKTKINLAEEDIIEKENLEKGKYKRVKYVWETEHIIPQKNEKDYDPDYIRCLGNLTLISGKLNGEEVYKDAAYEGKRKYFLEEICEKEFLKEKLPEKDFYLNKFFVEKEIFDVATVEERYKQLKREFKNIFIDSTNAEFTLSRFEEIIGVHEMDKGE